jgi:hypothetical protein
MFGSYHYAFSPRISLTYALNKATVLRAGYGVFRIYPDYGRLNGCNYWCAGFSEEVLQYSMDFINPIFPLDQGVPSTPNPPIFDPALNNGGAVSWINENANKPAFMGSWTLDVQRDLPFQMMLDVAYVGSTTVHTWTGLENINQVDPKYLSLGNLLYKNVYDGGAVAQGIKPPYAGFQGSVAQALRPYAQYNSIGDMYQPTGYADYESLQVRFQKRFSKGLSFLVAYTYSKELGVPGSDTLGDTAGGGSVMALDTYNRRIEKAVVPWNEPQALAFSWMYELPVGRGKHFLPNLSSPLNQVIGGWQINTIQTYHSGVPISVTGGPTVPLFNSGSGGNANRPNWVSSNVRTAAAQSMGSFDPNKDLYLNINAFGQPAPFTLGNAPPYLPNVRTPAFYDENFSVFKKINLFSDSRYVEFRGEFFNLFNRVCFGGPAANINSPNTFGILSSQANQPRVIQFAMKFIF